MRNRRITACRHLWQLYVTGRLTSTPRMGIECRSIHFTGKFILTIAFEETIMCSHRACVVIEEGSPAL